MLSLYHIKRTFMIHGYTVTDTDDVDIKVAWNLDSDVAVILCNSVGSNKFIAKEIIEKVKTIASNPFVIPPKKHAIVVVMADNSRIKHEMKVNGTVMIDVDTEKVYYNKIDKQAEKELQIIKESIGLQENRESREENLNNIVHSKVFKKYHMTVPIILACILCFIFVKDNGRYGICYETVVNDRQWGNIVLYMFMHGSANHLFYNVLSLYIMGRFVERTYGTFCMLFVMLFGSVYGAFASILGYMTDIPTVGISGGIFALIGASVVINMKNIKGMRRAILYILITTLIQFLNPFNRTDYLCHIGGLVAGMLFMGIFVLLRKTMVNIEYTKSTRLLDEKGEMTHGF